MKWLGALLVSVSVLAGVAADEWDYARRKWREDLSDPSTGLGAEALRTNLAQRVGEWKKAMAWPDVKARAFAWLCEKTAIDVSEHDWFPTFARWTRHADKLHPFLPQMMKRTRGSSARWAIRPSRRARFSSGAATSGPSATARTIRSARP